MKNKIIYILTASTLFFLPKINFAQAPELGTADSFALFTAVGEFTNIGATFVTGNIGTNVGAFSGYPPGTLVGQIHVVDAISAQAATDLNAAYVFLNGVPCGLAIGTILGNGQILTPGVYCQAAASTLNGDLTLDAQGNSNAIFIIKIGGAFSTSSLSKVILINGASSCNVYWQFSGAFASGDSSVFKGTMIVDGEINLNTGTVLDGRALAINGALHTFTMNATKPGVCSVAPLPIELSNFTASCENGLVNLNWTTMSETNNEKFEIDRSSDGMVWDKILSQQGANNSNVELNYEALDNNPFYGTSYYRLRQVDYNGNSEEFNPVSVNNISTNLNIEFYPNPVKEGLVITITGLTEDNPVSIIFYDLSGRIAFQKQYGYSSSHVEDYIPVTLIGPAGLYCYTIKGIESEPIRNGKIIITD